MIPIRDTAPCYSKPIVTWCLIGVCTVVFLAMYFMPDAWSYRLLYLFGMVPVRYANGWEGNFGLPFDGYFSFATNLFIHSSWLHLLVNVWFLWIFADNVEDRMGRWRFLGFYLWCGVFATALQWYFDPELSIPVVGASGAIAGVLGAYFFLYPLERVIVLVPPLLFNIPAIAFLGVWILWQLHNATTEMIFKNGPVDVAWWAHLGGFIVGAISYRWFLRPWQRQ